jgi:hypothetical protein
VLKGRLHVLLRGRFDDEVNALFLSYSALCDECRAGSVQVSTYRRTFAVEFSKTGAAS